MITYGKLFSVNALLTVSASWALTVLFPICLRIFAFDWKYVEELVPEILHDYSQRLAVQGLGYGRCSRCYTTRWTRCRFEVDHL